MKSGARSARSKASSSIGQWVRLSNNTATSRLVEAIDAFESLDFPAGEAAAGFLEGRSSGELRHDENTSAGDRRRVEGFISLCSGSVKLSERSIRSLGLRTTIRTMPATVLTWVARHREGSTSGLELVETAFALARESAEEHRRLPRSCWIPGMKRLRKSGGRIRIRFGTQSRSGRRSRPGSGPPLTRSSRSGRPRATSGDAHPLPVRSGGALDPGGHAETPSHRSLRRSPWPPLRRLSFGPPQGGPTFAPWSRCLLSPGRPILQLVDRQIVYLKRKHVHRVLQHPSLPRVAAFPTETVRMIGEEVSAHRLEIALR